MKKINTLFLFLILIYPFNLKAENQVYFINLKKVLNESKAGSGAQEKLLKEFSTFEQIKSSDIIVFPPFTLIDSAKSLLPSYIKKNINMSMNMNMNITITINININVNVNLHINIYIYI